MNASLVKNGFIKVHVNNAKLTYQPLMEINHAVY